MGEWKREFADRSEQWHDQITVDAREFSVTIYGINHVCISNYNTRLTQPLLHNGQALSIVWWLRRDPATGTWVPAPNDIRPGMSARHIKVCQDVHSKRFYDGSYPTGCLAPDEVVQEVSETFLPIFSRWLEENEDIRRQVEVKKREFELNRAKTEREAAQLNYLKAAERYRVAQKAFDEFE